MIRVTDGPGPYVIERRLPSIIQTRSDTRQYVEGLRQDVDDNSPPEPIVFPTQNDAASFLRSNATPEELDHYDWVIITQPQDEPVEVKRVC